MPDRAVLPAEAGKSVVLYRRDSTPSNTTRAIPPACAAGSASFRKCRNSLLRVPIYDSWASCEEFVQSEGQKSPNLNVQVRCHKLLIPQAERRARYVPGPTLNWVVPPRIFGCVEKSLTPSAPSHLAQKTYRLKFSCWKLHLSRRKVGAPKRKSAGAQLIMAMPRPIRV
jgi:hypothetical protein